MMLGLLLLMASFAGATPPQSADNTRSPHGNLNMPCQNCHTVYGWKPIRAVPEFDHNQTKFPLRGLHEGVSCVGCHTKMVFTNVGNKCADCHADIHRGKMSGACESCHTVRGWKVSVTQISMHSNRFPLTGAHAAAACEDCHKNGALSNFTLMSTDCISCHQADFNRTTSPNHTMSSAFSSQPCQSCHNTDSWLGAKFDHAAAGFPLVGQHAVPPRACEDCHSAANGGYNITTTACYTCHRSDYNNTTNPPHVQMPQAFPTDAASCALCHGTSYVAWQPAQFPNHSLTGFPLTGSHTVPPRQCTDCHSNNNYQITVTTCVSCHQTDYNNTNNPPHVQQGFATTCELCHNTMAWEPAQFDHAASGFPLTNAHAVPPRACTDCHVNNNYNITNTACVSCHQTDYNNAITPVNHVQATFPLTCQNCHDTIQWSDGTFNHSSTGFNLTNAHAVPPRACTDCHNATFGGYNVTSGTCVNCHQTDYNNAITPVDHKAANFPLTCETCHDTVVWTDGKFDHTAMGFLLTNAHAVPPRTCADCHNAAFGGYNIGSGACVNCHQTDYNNATTPVNHKAANFPLTCDTCHDTVVWTDGKFDHTAIGFPLTNAHAVPPRACTDCHNAQFGGYAIASGTCVNCHQTDYNNATTPVPHAGFPTTCDVCHDTIAWTDATFNHNNTPFPLQGAHTTVPCVNCHVNNNYTTLPTDCYGCHATDYNNTTNPVHSTAGFPTTCVTCHTTWITTNWLGATFNHTWFPMTHGNAGGICATCHTNPNDYSVFQCTGCHGNNNAANFHHPNVSGYVYNSINCLNCHKNGNGG